MKNFASLFFLVFCGIAASWYGLLVVGANALNPQELPTTLSAGGEDVVINGSLGLAARGQQVYGKLGCVVCHTQQVRRPGYGGDFARKWGSRQSVARDYVLEKLVLLGDRRMGPDLSNVGTRHDAKWFYAHLYDPTSNVKVTTMPSYPFLFKAREVNANVSFNALDLKGNDTPEDGFEVIPTEDAIALVAYLQSLSQAYDLPESKRVK